MALPKDLQNSSTDFHGFAPIFLFPFIYKPFVCPFWWCTGTKDLNIKEGALNTPPFKLTLEVFMDAQGRLLSL